MCKKLTTTGITKGNNRRIPLCYASDYAVNNKRNQKPWHERIRTLMEEFGFTKKEGKDVYIDAVIMDTLQEAPNANDEEKYIIAHKKFKHLFRTVM